MISTLIGALVCVAIVRQYGWRGLYLTIAGMSAAFILGAAGLALRPYGF